jgi:glycosyltransferase involved in cell wall biosynthesis
MSSGRVRLGYLVSTLRRAGPNSQLLNIIRHLDEGAFAARVVTLSPEDPSSMIDEYRAAGIEVRSLAMSRIRGATHRDWHSSLERVVEGSLTDGFVLHSQGIRADIIASRHLWGVRRVATARNYPYQDYPMKFGPLLGRWMAWSHLRAFRALPAVVACSASLAGLLRRHGVDVAVIRNGVDTSTFRPAASDERAQLRRQFGFGAGERIGVCVGGLLSRKDPLGVIQAMRGIDDRNLGIVFAGGGILEERCRRESAADERIRFLGHLGEVAPLLRAADFLVSASRSEGMPNAALEAIACGLPVVLSDIEPHRELLALAPWAGALYAIGDVAGLRSAIRQAASGAANPPGTDSSQVALLFGAERMSQCYQDLYRRLAAAEAAR